MAKAQVVPPYEQLFNPTLAALHGLGGSASIPELVERVIADQKFPREVVEFPHGDGAQSKLEYRLAWARTYLKKYGLLENSSRGVWSLTPKGQTTRAVDPAEVVKTVRAMPVDELVAEEVSRDEALRLAVQQIESQFGRGSARRLTDRVAEVVEDGAEAEEADQPASWREVLLRRLAVMPPPSFERLCMRVLRESGFIQVEVTGRSGDGGIDGYGVVRLVGMLSFRVSFQCKRYKDNVGSSVVRDFRGAMQGRAEKGLIITTSGFTRDARREAVRDGATAIDLIDGELLAEKLKELALGVKTTMVEAVEIEEKWFDSI